MVEVMRVKYNNKFVYKDSSYGRSNIYLKYRNYIDDLLTPTINSYRKYTYYKLYVEHPLCSEFIKYKTKREVEDFLYVTGLTGTGKTSLLKAVFGYYENTYVLGEKTLVIPFTCDSFVGNSAELKKRLANMFLGITRKLQKKYNLKKIEDNVDDFRDYIEKRRVQFSVNQRGWRDITADELLNQLYEYSQLEFALLAFKYTMGQDGNQIDNVVFIMDDVESVGVNYEVIPIYLANKIKECLNNRTQEEKEKWCCTVIVACRHFIFRKLFTINNNKTEEDPLFSEAGINRITMESFGGNDIDIGNGPTLKEIIEKRERSIQELMHDDERKDFTEICYVVNSVVNQVGELLLSLNLNDYRMTFRQLKSIVCNRRWLQRFESLGGAFKIGTAEENYFRNKPNIMRAIAIGENDVYFGNESIIPNLLENSKEGGDLWKLLVMGMFVRDLESNWDVSINLAVVKQEMKELFRENKIYFSEVDNAIIFLINKRLLLRGKLEEQRDSVDLRIIDAINAKYVYPSNALKILWDNLAENSILFELFVDDIWIENPVRKETDVGKKFIQFNLNNFKECMNYLDYLISVC